MSDSFALGGRRIVITRAPEQTTDLVQCLRGLGADVFFLPMVRFLDPETTDELDRAIDSLVKFDWLVFSSANAVRFFLKRCRALGCWPSSAMQIAAVGDATRAAIEAEDLIVRVTPEEFSGAALAATLEPEVAGKTILLPRSDRAGNELPDMLRAAGASVSEVVAYRTAEPDSLDDASRESLLRGDVDAITFFSPSAVHHFVRVLGSAGVREVSERVVYAAVGPVTAAAIANVGLTAAMQADEASPTSLAMALVRYFGAHPVAKERI